MEFLFSQKTNLFFKIWSFAWLYILTLVVNKWKKLLENHKLQNIQLQMNRFTWISTRHNPRITIQIGDQYS